MLQRVLHWLTSPGPFRPARGQPLCLHWHPRMIPRQTPIIISCCCRSLQLSGSLNIMMRAQNNQKNVQVILVGFKLHHIQMWCKILNCQHPMDLGVHTGTGKVSHCAFPLLAPLLLFCSVFVLFKLLC